MDFTLFCMCFLSWVFHRRTAPLFSLPFSARWGRDWRGKPCVPFSVCESSETITKTSFSPLFAGAPAPLFFLPFPARWGRDWKGKPCVPFSVCEGSETITKHHFLRFLQAHLRRFSSCRFRHSGEGIGKGNFVALSSVAEVWNPFRNGFQVFVTF